MRLVIGISGASGAPLAVKLLQELKKLPDVETHLVITRGGELTIRQETDMDVADVKALADVIYDNWDAGAALASGSFKTDGMIIVPCSMKTLAGVHSGYCDNLLLRAADVTLKESRKLLLVPRECPFSPIHLGNMYELSRLGVRILPPVVSYYNKPETADDITCHIVGKIMDCFGLDYEGYKRWGGMND